MKKSSNRTTERKKLALRREVIVVLTPLQLTDVAGGEELDGGCTYFSSCRPPSG
ncbi:MAG TPA: class I lanthipeptide [Kofleriaceae bacterium]|nr:class I lanthipeptide [Kofleriaceae bacterium]